MIQLRNILVPVDFSECSRIAYEQACEYADQFGAALHVLHVNPVTNWPDPNSSGSGSHDCELDHFLGGTSEHCFPVVRTVTAGSPTHVICEYADEVNADIVIMGTHGGDLARKRVLGSVAEHVVRLAKCDVLAVHERRSSSSVEKMQPALVRSA